MAKRFIDTNIFSDEWFSNLSKDGKLFFIYFITNCDHAGVLHLNKKLCEFQIGIKSIERVIKELGNSLLTLKEGLLFMPKFLIFQYPDFPKSKVRQQEGALKILQNLGFSLENLNSYIRVIKELPNSYVNDNVNVTVTVTDNVSDRGIKGENKKHLFEQSDFFNFIKFEAALQTDEKYSPFDFRFYHEALKNWSAEGNSKKNWLATAKNWMLRDLKDGKPKLKTQYQKQFNNNGKDITRAKSITEMRAEVGDLDA